MLFGRYRAVNLYAYILSSVFIPPEIKFEGVFRIELVGLSVHQIWWFPDTPEHLHQYIIRERSSSIIGLV